MSNEVRAAIVRVENARKALADAPRSDRALRALVDAEEAYIKARKSPR